VPQITRSAPQSFHKFAFGETLQTNLPHISLKKKRKTRKNFATANGKKKYKINQGKKGNDKNQAAGQNQKEWADKKRGKFFW